MTYYSFAQQAHVFESEYQGYKPYTDGWETFPFAGMTLEECAEAAHKEAIRLLDEAGDFYAAAVEDSEEGDYRNRTLQEIMGELKEDMPYLEAHLYWWMVEAGDSEAIFDPEPFTVATSWWFNGAGGLDTLTVKAWASEESFRTQNPNVKLVPSRDGIRNHTKWMLDSVYDHPEGGQYYP